MRASFIKTLTEVANDDPRVMLLTGDLGFMAIEPFSEAFPDRFLNIGVAEQNMVGVASGLAEAGYIPFCYSIAPFATLRPYEFIRNGPVHHRLPVRIVGVGGGFEYGTAGPSHHAIEDIAVMRALPGMTVVAPADAPQTVTALRATWDLKGPVYYRIGKDERTVIPGLDARFSLGHAETLRPGEDMLIVTTGSISVEAVAAADFLNAEGVSAGVMTVASIEPAPVDDLVGAMAGVRAVVTLEAHVLAGGLGTLVAEIIAERGLGCRLRRIAVSNGACPQVGSTAHLHQVHGLSANHVIGTARLLLAST
jgi:transketolase